MVKEETLLSIENGGKVWRKVGNKVEVFIPNEGYEVYVIKSPVTGKFVACIFKAHYIRSRYDSKESGGGQASVANVSTMDKEEYIKFIEQYGKFVKEEESS